MCLSIGKMCSTFMSSSAYLSSRRVIHLPSNSTSYLVPDALLQFYILYFVSYTLYSINFNLLPNIKIFTHTNFRSSKTTNQLTKLEVYITQLLIPTHAHFHWLKFIKNI